MAIKKFSPTSPGRRFYTVQSFDEITATKPLKSLTEPKTSSGGRNSNGRITVRFRGGGHKRRYRVVDFKRNKLDVPGKVASVEYDPNRSARIARIHYLDGEKAYIIHPGWFESWRFCRQQHQLRYPSRELSAAREHAFGNDGSQHRAQAGQGWPDGTKCRRRCPTRCQRGQVRPVAATIR